MDKRLPDRFYGGYYGYGGSLSAPARAISLSKEKELMSSKVKVKVERTKLITLLEERLTTLTDEPIHPLVQELIEALEAAAEHLRTGGSTTDSRGYHVETLVEVNRLRDDVSALENRRGGLRERDGLRDKINRQLKLLNLSDDEHIEVGIEDEIYELL